MHCIKCSVTSESEWVVDAAARRDHESGTEQKKRRPDNRMRTDTTGTAHARGRGHVVAA